MPITSGTSRGPALALPKCVAGYPNIVTSTGLISETKNNPQATAGDQAFFGRARRRDDAIATTRRKRLTTLKAKNKQRAATTHSRSVTGDRLFGTFVVSMRVRGV